MDFETVLPLKTVSDIIKEVKETDEPTHPQVKLDDFWIDSEGNAKCECENCTCK